MISFTLDDREITARPGDTLADALYAGARLRVGDSLYRARPRGLMAAGVEEPNALFEVGARRQGDVAESMLPATTIELTEGLALRTLSGIGRLDPARDQSHHDHVHRHAEVLVIGGGPAGLAAATRAARSGARVILLDERPALGGLLAGTSEPLIDGLTPDAWIEAARKELAGHDEVLVLPRTTAIGSYDQNYVVAVERRTAHLGGEIPAGVPRERVWHLRAEEIILATGAHERHQVFADNDRPGIMLAASLRRLHDRHGRLPGQRLVIATMHDSAYDLASDLDPQLIAAIIDSRPDPGPRAEAARGRGIEVITGAAVVGTEAAGGGALAAVRASGIDEGGQPIGEPRILAADLLAVSGGWAPVIHLHSQRQKILGWDEREQAFVPERAVAHQRCAGAVTGTLDLPGVLAQGAHAGAGAAIAAGFDARVDAPVTPPSAAATPPRILWVTPPRAEAEPQDYAAHFVDLQRDRSVADVLRSTGAGMRSVEHVKRYTSISTAHDQGKTSSLALVGVIAHALGRENPQGVGITAYRPPYTPVAFATLAGARRGKLFDPTRITPMHAWHVAHGAEFEDVGQWKRARHYPLPGEDRDAAVLRECRAVRESVGFMDATTLGKIEIRGADAGAFLNRIYTNGFAKLAPGRARYGVMCTPDGMIFDDGVTLRLDDERYLMTTTTGNAAAVLDWLEEWLQTEWPELDVSCTSVTEQYATIAVVGPDSRVVIARLAPELDVSPEGFGFMEFRETVLASGVRARISRISFSGELAYEIAVDAWHGAAVWEDVAAAGKPHGITPYGTETMHVLRAEKGYIIVGQDTDGTVTPQDAGMEWVVSSSKTFIGQRSHARADARRADRKHLVSVLPVDPDRAIAEGAQLVDLEADLSQVPVRSHGWVTSAYRSAAMERTFGLALIEGGRERQGERLLASFHHQLVEVEIGPTVLFDPEGARRDG